MSLTLTFIGTGGAQQVPAFGCRCRACERAHADTTRRRGPCSATLECAGAVTLIDAGLPDLMERFPAGSFRQILLTHYHMDHVQGLFPLRWGVGDTLPVYGPPDKQGCDDLFKHPGLLDFSHTLTPFASFHLQDIRVTPLPLNHSKLTFGYLLESTRSKLAWLCDTAGLPPQTLKYLSAHRPDVMVIDCTYAPCPETPRNHCDLNTVIALNASVRAPRVLLTHIGHEFDVWMMENPLPQGVEAARDGQVIELP